MERRSDLLIAAIILLFSGKCKINICYQYLIYLPKRDKEDRYDLNYLNLILIATLN